MKRGLIALFVFIVLMGSSVVSAQALTQDDPSTWDDQCKNITEDSIKKQNQLPNDAGQSIAIRSLKTVYNGDINQPFDNTKCSITYIHAETIYPSKISKMNPRYENLDFSGGAILRYSNVNEMMVINFPSDGGQITYGSWKSPTLRRGDYVIFYKNRTEVLREQPTTSWWGKFKAGLLSLFSNKGSYQLAYYDPLKQPTPAVARTEVPEENVNPPTNPPATIHPTRNEEEQASFVTCVKSCLEHYTDRAFCENNFCTDRMVACYNNDATNYMFCKGQQ